MSVGHHFKPDRLKLNGTRPLIVQCSSSEYGTEKRSYIIYFFLKKGKFIDFKHNTSFTGLHKTLISETHTFKSSCGGRTCIIPMYLFVTMSCFVSNEISDDQRITESLS